jgi:uroporphyrinogen-III synthase
VKVAILRPKEVAKYTVRVLREEGFDVIAIPFIKIVKRDFNFNPKDFDVLIVTSRTSARILVEKGVKHDNVIAIGRKTAEELKKVGINPRLPSRFDSRTLYEEFKEELEGKRVAILRSNRGDPILLKIPNAKEIVLYDINFEWGEEQEKLLKELDFDVIVFSSRMIVKSFFELAKEMNVVDDVISALKNKTVIAIGPPTKEELKKYGLKVLMPKEWTFDGVVELLKSIKTAEQT